MFKCFCILPQKIKKKTANGVIPLKDDRQISMLEYVIIPLQNIVKNSFIIVSNGKNNIFLENFM